MFQQPTEIPEPCHLPQRDLHLETPRRVYLEEGESTMTALRLRITTHFPAWRVDATNPLKCFDSATWDQVRSSSKNILWERENSLCLARSARSRSPTNLNRMNRVESTPNQALSRVISRRSRLSQRNMVPTYIKFEEGMGKGSPLIFNLVLELTQYALSLTWP
jgi:hypothetical protein